MDSNLSLSNGGLLKAWQSTQSRIGLACDRASRQAATVTVVAVTKTLPPVFARKACALGLDHIGENRVQEAIEKFGDGWLKREWPAAHLHLIGHLQSNKVRKAVEVFDAIDSIDSLRLARLIDRESKERGRRIRVLLEVNTSGEPQKSGVDPTEVIQTCEDIAGLSNLSLAGLMTVGPLTDDVETIRDSFRQLHDLFGEVRMKLALPEWTVLSMGMSSDFEMAIEEGATEIRLGTALFGSRG